MLTRRFTWRTPLTELHFERFYIYGLRPEVDPGFRFVLSLTTTVFNYRREVNNLSFLPLIVPTASADGDPFRVRLSCGAASSNRLTSRHYAVVDGIQSLNKRAFLPQHLGRLTDTEQTEVMAKLSKYLGLGE